MKVIASGLDFPEGPIALDDGSWLVVEIKGQRLTRITSSGEKSTIADVGGGPNGAAMGPDGHCYICNNGGFEWQQDADGPRPIGQADNYTNGSIQRVNLTTGVVEELYSSSDTGPLRGPNDLVFDRHGGFWFTDSGKSRHRDMDRGGVYYAKADGSMIREVIYPMVIPNGIGLSRNEDSLYVAETSTARLWVFDIASPGELTRQPWPSMNGGRLVAGCSDFVMFDSLALDARGNICVASLIKGGITVISPGGEIVDHVPLPDRYTTNICFAAGKSRCAYVTLAQSGQLVEIPWPCGGQVLN